MDSNLASALGFGLQVPGTKKNAVLLSLPVRHIYLGDLTGKRSEPS